MRIERFEDSEAWQYSKKLVNCVYGLTLKDNFKIDFGLKDQVQRAAVSCMSNIAEGFDSDSDQQFIQFLNYAKRSASEVQSLLYVAKDLKYITSIEFHQVYELAKSVRKLCSGFVRYLKKTGDWRPETGD